MIDYKSIISKYNELGSGAAKMKAIEKAIEIADNEKEYVYSLIFREDYIHESIFNDDTFKAIIMFPEYLSIYDNNLDKIEDEYTIYDVLWVYKWVLNSCLSFYQISNDSILKYYEDFKTRLQENGYSLRIYYYLFSGYIEDIDKEKYKQIGKEYLNFRRDGLSDCETCELNDEINFEIKYGSFKKAMKKAKPILNGEKKCAHVPALLYDRLLNYYIEKKEIENASVYAKLLYKKISKNIYYLDYIGDILKYYSLCDINKGIEIFTKYLNWDLKSKNPRRIFNFELGAYELLKNLKQNEDKETIKLLLDKKFPLYNESGIYIVDDIIKYYKTNITDIADKFDKRNGNDYFRKMID